MGDLEGAVAFYRSELENSGNIYASSFVSILAAYAEKVCILISVADPYNFSRCTVRCGGSFVVDLVAHLCRCGVSFVTLQAAGCSGPGFESSSTTNDPKRCRIILQKDPGSE